MAVAAAETTTYIQVDDIPEIAAARHDVRQQAWGTIEDRRRLAAQGLAESIPLSVDALTTARQSLHAKETHGEASQQYHDQYAGLRLDCTRLLSEWYRKNTYEYFPLSRHVFDPETEDFFSHGLSIRQMTENALTPHNDNPEEEARRVNERVEEATPNLLRKLGGLALNGTRIRTVSECTDKAIADYQSDLKLGKKHRGYSGYVPEIEKVMIRDVIIDQGTHDRFEEQVGLPGIYITHDIIQEAIARRGVDVADKDKTELHGTQLLASDDLIEFVELLDTVASEEWCTNIFMGEQVAVDHPKPYDTVRKEAYRRQQTLQTQSHMVTDFVQELAQAETDSRQAPAIIEAFVKKLLLGIAREDTALAPQIFDEKTAAGLRRVAELEAYGRLQEAQALFDTVETAAPGGVIAGRGSCGLEAVRGGDVEHEALKKLGFGDNKNTIKDTERKCLCGAKTIYYDLKQKKKGCTTCGKTAKY